MSRRISRRTVSPGRTALAVIALVAGFLGPASATTTNQISTAPRSLPEILLEGPPPVPEGFWGTYAVELITNSSRVALDQLGYPAELDLARKFAREKYKFHEHLALLGRRVFFNAASDSLREAATASFPLEEWQEYGASLPARLSAKFVSGSLGNTLEERAPSVSASPSYAIWERSWLYAARQNGIIDYGLRPWRLDPYVYCTAAFHLGRRPLLMDTRCYSLLDSRRIGLMRIQEQVVLPLFNSLHVVVGFSVCPTEIHSRDWSPAASVRIERVIHIAGYSGIGYLGAQSGPRQTRCMIGLALVRW